MVTLRNKLEKFTTSSLLSIISAHFHQIWSLMNKYIYNSLLSNSTLTLFFISKILIFQFQYHQADRNIYLKNKIQLNIFFCTFLKRKIKSCLVFVHNMKIIKFIYKVKRHQYTKIGNRLPLVQILSQKLIARSSQH